jgi:hypothetical protein
MPQTTARHLALSPPRSSAIYLAVANLGTGSVTVLLNQRRPHAGDMSCDGVLNGADIDPFFACLGAGGCTCP